MATTTISASTRAPKITGYVRGDSRAINIQVVQADGVTPFDLSGCELFLTLNPATNPGNDDSGAVLEVSTNVFADPASGQGTLLLTNQATQNLAPATYYYDIQLKDANGNITSLAQNTFQVLADITRRIT